MSYNERIGNMDAAFGQAVGALKQHRLRTLMSVLGVAFGIAAMMTVGVVSESGRAFIFAELETYGLTGIWIYRDWSEDNPYATVRQGSGIDNEDLALLRSDCCPAVRRISPSVYPEDWMLTVRAGNSFSKSSVEGVDVEYLAINNDQLASGRNFRVRDILDRLPVAIIGENTARKLYGVHQSPLGRSLRLREMGFTVIGVLRAKDRNFLDSIGAGEGYDINDRVLIPYTVYQQALGIQDVHTLRADAANLARVDEAAAQLRGVLERRHQGRYNYTVDTMQEWIGTANRILDSISVLGLVSASVALLVGGMGILSIMSTAVLERTREIGLRKALGARQSDIRLQFLVEAVCISSLGGLVGLVLGFGAVMLLALWTGFPLAPAWLHVIVALVVSIAVGVASGYYPAKRAAGLRPVEALRHE